MTADQLTIFLEKAADPILLCQRDGTLVWANAIAGEMFPPLLSQGAHLSDLLTPVDAQRVLATVHRATFDLSGPVGPRGLRLSALVVDLAGRGLGDGGYLLTLQSTSSESRLLNKQQDFLSAAAHDLKNPIGAIFGLADALIDTQLGNGMNEQQKEVAHRIRSTAARSLEMVRNYQYLAQIDSPLLFQTAAVSDINPVLEGIVQHSWRPAQNITLRMDLATEPLLARAERSHLDRIFSNIFHNAMKFTPAEGKIAVSSRVEGESLKVKVFNSGSFIPQQEQTLLFKRFTQGASGRTKGGTGLGLFIAASLANSLGGEITVESSREVGTAFTVTLPRHVAHPEETTPGA